MPYHLLAFRSECRSTAPVGRLMATLACLALLVGCATTDTPNTAWQGTDGAGSRGVANVDASETATRRGACGEPMSAAIGMQITLIRQMLDAGKPRAALAHLDNLALAGPDADLAEPRLLRGEALRRTGKRDAADRIYEGLTDTCLAADAWRGIARNQAARGDMRGALVSMRKARESRPIDAAIRNDLGYLYLLEGQARRAEEEFLTALELAGQYPRAARNLVMALYAQGDARRAARIGARYGIDQKALDLLRQTRLATNAAPAGTAAVPAAVIGAIDNPLDDPSPRRQGMALTAGNRVETSGDGAITHTPVAMPDNTAFELEITRQ